MRRTGKRQGVQIYLLLAAMLAQMIFGSSHGVQAAEQAGDPVRMAIEQAGAWLYAAQKDGRWENGELPNTDCAVIQALKAADSQADFSMELSNLRQQNGIASHDGLARYLTADTGNEEILDTLLAGQNEDGGFGLTADYASDTLDTLLALEACHTAGKREQAEAAAEYLLSVQKEDGSWSYAEGGAADTVLTARAGSAILHQQNNGDGYLDEEKLRLTESCLSSANRYALTQEKLAETLYLSLYDSEWGMSIPEAKARAEALAEIQETDGSFYGDISLTALAVRVLVRLDGLAPAVKIEDFALALSPQGIYAGAPVQLSASYTMEYYANYNTAYTVKIAVIKENGTVLAEKEQEIPLTAGRESRTGKLLELEINEPETGVLTVKAEIRDEAQKLVGEYSREFNVKEQLKVSERFQLDAEVTEGKDYGLRLSWNELSDEETDYTYRIWQKKEDAGWTTRSVWNEESRVKVLNVYPTTDTRNCLKNWMETTVDSGAEPAGKGLFDITPVYLDEYNRNAEACLLDAEGNYQYDVLFFGAADCNGKKDLTEGSYQATRKFIDSGRGVLFGHDTVCLVVDRINQMEHNFAKFSEQLGILVKDKFYQSNTNKAEICNTGFLTSYPWKISGTLNIPATHSVGQFCGGTLEGTVWVKLLNSYVQTDGATGARTDAYLVTNNQLGLIMTGHSTNQATDDERKILANTLFYLKQVSSETELCDCSFIDEAAPEKVRAASAVSACEADKFRLSTTLEAADRGTNYQYYAEAQPERSSGRENEASNHISAEALSGIRGYVYEINTNPEAMPELITYEADGRTVYGVTEAAEDGRLVFETPELSCEETYYLHAYAVDWANCVSEELVEKLSWQEADCPYNGIITELSMNKEVYLPGETAVISVSARTEALRCDAAGVLAVYDKEGNPVTILDEDIKAALVSGREWTKEYRWDIPGLLAGDYRIKLIWSDRDQNTAEGTADFAILPDGAFEGTVSTDKPEFLSGEAVTLIGEIGNTTTNAIASGLKQMLTMYDAEGVIAARYEGAVTELLPGNQKTELFVLPSSGMTGACSVKQEIFCGGEVLVQNSSSFTLLAPTLKDSLAGTLNASLADNNSLKLTTVLTNTGTKELSDIRTQLRIINMETQEVSLVIPEGAQTLDSGCGVTHHYEDTRRLPAGRYLILYEAVQEDGTLFGLDSAGAEIMPGLGLLELEKGLYAFGEEGLTINYSQTEAAGRWQSAGNVGINGSVLHHGGQIRTSGIFEKYGTIVEAPDVEEHAELAPMEDYSGALYTYMGGAAVTDSAAYSENTAIEEKQVSRTGITIEAEEAALHASVAAEGDIRINVNALEAGGEEPVVIASLNGDIRISAAQADTECILYAPNGTVYVDVSILKFKGTIVAERIVLGGAGLRLNQN